MFCSIDNLKNGKYSVNPWSHVTVHGRGYFFSLNTTAPCFLKAFDMGDVLPPPRSPSLRSGAGVSPTAKAGKTTGASVKLFKEISLPVNGCHPCPAAGAVCLLQGFDRGPDCTASPARNE